MLIMKGPTIWFSSYVYAVPKFSLSHRAEEGIRFIWQISYVWYQLVCSTYK